MAVGRSANVESLDLKNTDVHFTKSGHIQVDDFENTTAQGVHAVGDVNGKIALTPVAIRAGRTLAERLFNNRPTIKMDYENIPSVIFSHPPIGSVGLSEEKAIMRYGKENVVIYKTQFGNMYDSLVQGDKLKVKTFMKMVCLKKGADEKVIGFHAIGKGVDEMIQGVAVALKAGGKFSSKTLKIGLLNLAIPKINLYLKINKNLWLNIALINLEHQTFIKNYTKSLIFHYL